MSTKPNGLLEEIGPPRMEKRADGKYVVHFPVQHHAIYLDEVQARELFQAVSRRDQGLPSGFNPNGLKSAPRGQGEVFNARAVRKLVKDDIALGDFLDCCRVEIPKLLDFIDQADAGSEEKSKIKQTLLRFQVQERLRRTQKENQP